jgi:tryprostatin B 6-hydroxylase
MSALLVPLEGRTPSKQDIDLLRGDTQLIVVAGRSVVDLKRKPSTMIPFSYITKLRHKVSDTTSSALSCALFELAKRPEHITKLREELAPYIPDASAEVQHEKIAHLNHLNGIINETLRLHPPVPAAMHRKTPAEGIEIDGTYVPGNMTVASPQHVLGRGRLGLPCQW